MISYESIETKSLLITLFIRLFNNKFVIMFYNILITTMISIHVAKIDLESQKWKYTLLIYVIIYIILNLLSIIADSIKSKEAKKYNYIKEAYESHSSLNFQTANSLYRVNKKISRTIHNKKIKKEEVKSIIDFQNLSFSVCNELHNFISNTCKCKECQITIFQRFSNNDNKDYVKMIAYKNSKNSIPSTYNKEYRLFHKNKTHVPVFISIFCDLNAETKILENIKAVKEEFVIFEDSKAREENIHQYIGIPIKTNRNKIEVLLQIDISEKDVLGKTYNDVKQFADMIMLPFVNLLYCSYERDLILNRFYDILEENVDGN